eukprot:m.295874 g.295874  ORF g.295874 m.295874 type:complete len:388 (-) comp20052_c1_seq4:414-1577(-)
MGCGVSRSKTSEFITKPLQRSLSQNTINWVMVSYTSADTEVAHHIVTELEDSGLQVKGGGKSADTSSNRQQLVSGAGAFLAIMGPQYQRNKRAKLEYMTAKKFGIPIAIAVTGPPGFHPAAEWIKKANSVKEVDFTYFQNPAAFDVNIALLVLQLSPTNFSDVAREMSVIVPDNVAPARDDVQKLTDKMKEPTIDAKGIRRIFRQLMGMALTESTCGMLAEGTTMAVLVRQMTKFVAHVDVALYGGWTLMHMAATSVPARHALVAHGGLQVLHAAARQHAADLGVQSHFALTLGFMAQSDIAVEVAVVGTLVDALQQHVGDAQLQLHCIRALTCIHTSTTNADVLSPATLHTKVIAALKSTISAYPSDSITATAAKTCVESLQRSGI